MFAKLRIHGAAGTILWGYRPAATLRSWRIVKVQEQWTLIGNVTRCEAFMVRQKPLLFTAPRTGTRDGFWAWGVESIELGNGSLVAKLGQPEQ